MDEELWLPDDEEDEPDSDPCEDDCDDDDDELDFDPCEDDSDDEGDPDEPEGDPWLLLDDGEPEGGVGDDDPDGEPPHPASRNAKLAAMVERTMVFIGRSVSEKGASLDAHTSWEFPLST